MTYQAQNFDRLLGTQGFSDTLLNNHFKLYQGYVANVNKLIDILKAMTKDGKEGTPEFAEIKRRFGWEFNGMRLHELYFGNMVKGGGKLDPKSKLMKRIAEAWGSYETWEANFRSTGAMRGIGWAILYLDPDGNYLFNDLVSELDMGHLAGCIPLLVLDIFEHAYVTDYGINRADYIKTFFNSIDWKVAEGRFTGALK